VREKTIKTVTPVTVASIGTSLPAHRVENAELLSTLAQIWPRLKQRTALLEKGLDSGARYLVRPVGEFATPVTLDEQTRCYLEEATTLAADAAERALANADGAADDIGLLVVSSCTGYALPGVDVRLVDRLGLRRDIRRLPLAHFGCAGGAAGLAQAVDWVRAHEGQRALVVAVEVPSITFRPSDTSADNLLSALVFGDGAGAAVLQATAEPGRLCIGRSLSTLVPSSHSALGFELASDGFRVVVSRRLPQLLATHLPALVADFSKTPVAELSAVALHPGGRAIIDAVVDCLGLDEAQISATRRALARSGNTSSAALLFVLAELAASLPAVSGTGLAAAFGPGLTIELLELSWSC